MKFISSSVHKFTISSMNNGHFWSKKIWEESQEK